MEELDTPRYKPGSAQRSAIEKELGERRMRQLLTELISSSSDLNLRVWLDGVYTNVEDAHHPKGSWMDGREVYFKVEGRVPGIRELISLPTGGS